MGTINKNLCFIFLLAIIFYLLILLMRTPVKISNKLQQNSIQEGKKPGNTDSMIILYNRIPKTGSTSFMSVVYKLYSQNKFSAMYVNVSSTSHRFTFADQQIFAKNITNWTKRKPCIYHGHFPFLNFIFLSLKQPLYINIVREPLQRVVSHYYFLRYGDTFVPNKIRNHQGDTRTFDQCVEEKSKECNLNKIWLQIPYFCGSEPECWKVGSLYALDRAKFNVITYYYLVGVTEQIEMFVEILERNIPSFFHGATTLFTEGGGVHIRKTKVKKPLAQKTIDFFQNSKIYQMEKEFYLFIKERFNYIYKKHKDSNAVKLSYLKVKPDLSELS